MSEKNHHYALKFCELSLQGLLLPCLSVHDAQVRLFFHIMGAPLSLLTCTDWLGSPNPPFRTVIHVHIRYKYDGDIPPSELLALSLTPHFCFLLLCCSSIVE